MMKSAIQRNEPKQQAASKDVKVDLGQLSDGDLERVAGGTSPTLHVKKTR